MLPLSLFDFNNYLDVTLTFKDGASISYNDYSVSTVIYENPSIKTPIKEGTLGYIELCNLLTGSDSLDLLLSLLHSHYSISDIQCIQWNLTVEKDLESCQSLLRVIEIDEIRWVIEEAFSIIKKDSESPIKSELLVFLTDIFKSEVSFGFDILPFYEKALISLNPMDLVPEAYTLNYSYYLNIVEDIETVDHSFCLKP